MKYIIVDDNEIDADLASHFASRISELELVGKYNDAVKAFSALNASNDIELILCDIDMPGLSGMEMIKALQNRPQVIFLTHHLNMAVEGFEVDATDYLVKPYKFDRFLIAINKALKKAASTAGTDNQADGEDFFFIRADQQYFKIKYDDVVYIDALKDYVKIVTDRQTYVTPINLKTITDKLPEDTFFRANRSLVINLNKIESFDSFEIKFQGHSVLISEGTARKIQERIVNDNLIKKII